MTPLPVLTGPAMPILRNIAIGILFVWIVVDGFVVFRRQTGQLENRDHSSLRLLMISGPLLWFISIGLSFTAIGTLQLPTAQLVGLSVMLAGIVLRSVAIAQLGRFHTPNVAVLADHQLKVTGLYQYVRHPSYLSALVAFAGFGLALGNWLSLLLILLITPAIYLYRIREEELVLTEGLGDSYREYCRRTRRLIPGIY